MHFLTAIHYHLSTGRVQHTLSALAGLSALPSLIEVVQEHTTGSFGQKIMWSPLICCLLLALAGFAGAVSAPAARTILPAASALLILDGFTGFCFHIRGIARKPGGWRRNLVFNIVMGPPIFAPLILSMPAVLGLVAAVMLPEDSSVSVSDVTMRTVKIALTIGVVIYALLNGCEALYSHYKTRFEKRAQWTPIILAPLLALVGLVYLVAPGIGAQSLIIISLIAIAAGVVGMAFHLNGIRRRPGGLRHLPYNILYGPPLFAPMLFAATGLFGLLAAELGGAP